MNKTTSLSGDRLASDTWWIASLGSALTWARLRVQQAGSAEVFDCDGATVTYDSDDSARAALLDADYFALDGLDEDDAARLGVSLAMLQPPSATTDAQLSALMIQPLAQAD